MADSDDEPDYLSDEFLASCLPKEDVRPGLMNRHAEKRKHEQLKQQEKSNEDHRKKFKSIQQLQEEGRTKGLATAIGADNKGFQMLQKMGFKPGTTIGLNRSSEGQMSQGVGMGQGSTFSTMSMSLKEPIPIIIKADKKGLGGKSKLEEKRAKLEEWKALRTRMSDTNEYRNRVKQQVSSRETHCDLRLAQSAAKTLDLQHSKDEPSKIWFWPEIRKEDEDEEEKSEEEDEEDQTDDNIPEEIPLEPHEKLQAITEYLRNDYFYCIWCGSSYDDESDLKTSCPGNSRQDH